MGIGIVIIFWLFVFVFLATIYVILHFLAKKNEGAAELKKTFTALLAIAAVAVSCLTIFTVVNVFLDNFYPSRIFTKNFGFEPTADVRIIEGSSFWIPFNDSAYLKFQAREETIQKISLNGFTPILKEYRGGFTPAESKNISAESKGRYYEKVGSDIKTLIYDEQNQIAYFSSHSID